MRDSQGQLIGVLGVARDITRRKQTALQLDDYRQRLEGLVVEESTKFRALVEQSLVGIYIIQDGFFRYANPGLSRHVRLRQCRRAGGRDSCHPDWS